MVTGVETLVGLGVTVNTNSWLAVHPSFNLVYVPLTVCSRCVRSQVYVSPEQMVTGVETLVGLVTVNTNLGWLYIRRLI
jgi:hypothetical protein